MGGYNQHIDILHPERVRRSFRFFSNTLKYSNTMKKKISQILGTFCVIAVFAGCVEGLDGSLTAWTLVCLAVSGLSGWASKKLEGAR